MNRILARLREIQFSNRITQAFVIGVLVTLGVAWWKMLILIVLGALFGLFERGLMVQADKEKVHAKERV